MFHLPPSEGHYQFHPNSINEFSKCFIVSLFQTDRKKNYLKFCFLTIYIYLCQIKPKITMANTKNYSLREKIIDYYLSHGWYTRQQIEDACNRELEAHRV